MTTYKLSGENWVLKDGDTVVPTSPGLPGLPNTNPDYLAYQTWLAEGNLPLPADPVPPPVAIVTPRQARLALKGAGLLAAVDAWIAEADEETQIDWEFASAIRRDWPPIATCATALGLTETQLDELFALAGTL